MSRVGNNTILVGPPHDPERQVLPSEVVPLLYDLTITPVVTTAATNDSIENSSNNPDSGYRYEGSVDIHVNLTSGWTQEVILHAKELHIISATYIPNSNPSHGDGASATIVKGSGNGSGKSESEGEGEDMKGSSQEEKQKFEAVRFEYDTKETTVAIGFFAKDASKVESLPSGNGILRIEFIGCHNNQMAGFYRSAYTSASGEKKIMVSTQFEALDARRCFPCIDEPAAKAVFRATLIVDSHLTALSNMPEETITTLEGGKKKKVRFMDTPKMSTYLLAFCVGEFDFVQGSTKNGVLIRVFTPPTKSHYGEFALSVGLKTLDLYDDFFGLPYPLVKLDMIAIPEFAMGAMENWGLVTYREVDVLIDNERASSQQKQRVCTVVTHELAHQWFGNLVTMDWWDDLWLNEGFASWMQSYAADYCFPDWKMWEQFMNDDLANALRLDALATSHPIQVPIRRAEEVEEVFDLVSYCKGACVVRLIHAYLGPEKFKEGLRQYMKRHAYGNTRTEDLWRAWADASKDEKVPDIMRSWTEQMGFPMITVSNMSFDESKGVFRMKLRQDWFLSDGSTPEGHDAKQWKVPLIFSCGFTDSNDASYKIVHGGLLSQRETEVEVPAFSKGSSKPSNTKMWWCKVNGEQHIPIRVRYMDSDVIKRLGAAVQTKQMCAEDRCGLINDALALTKANFMEPGDLIQLLATYKNEDSMPVWESLESVLGGISSLLKHSQYRELEDAYDRFAANLIRSTADKVGWDSKESDGHLGKLLRAIMVRLQCDYMKNEPQVKEQVQKRFNTFVQDPNSSAATRALPADFKTPVFRAALASADPSTGEARKSFEQLKTTLASAQTSAERKSVYLALGSVPTREKKNEVMEWTSREVLIQDFFYPMFSVSASGPRAEGADVAWKFFLENFDRLHARVAKASPSLVMAIISACCAGFASKERAEEIRQFFEKHPVPLARRKVSQIIESTHANASFLSKIESSKAFANAVKQVQ